MSHVEDVAQSHDFTQSEFLRGRTKGVTPIRFMPMSEFQRIAGEEALLYVRELGCIIGVFTRGRSAKLKDGSIWTIGDHWQVDGYPGGGSYLHSDPNLLGWHPIDATVVILPVTAT